MNAKRRGAAGLLSLALTVGGCVRLPDEEVVTNRESVDLGQAESVEVELEMGAGELKVSAGSNKLMDAVFVTPPTWKPKVRYRVSGKQGWLTVDEPEGTRRFRHANDEWEVRLNERVPMELRIKLGAGTSRLELGGLALRELDIELGAGETEVDLTGDWKSDLRASIEGGVGTAKVRLPTDVGVRVEAETGIGEVSVRGLAEDGRAYVNKAYGKSPVTLRINVKSGIGTIRLETGRPSA